METILPGESGKNRNRYPRDKTIRQLFEAQVERTPTQIAVIGPSTAAANGVALTYGELNRRTNRLARALRNRGVGANTIVGILVERSVEMIVGILSILKAGGAYLPISPKYPPARKRYMLKDSGARFLLTHRRFERDFREDEDICLMALEDEGLYQYEPGNLDSAEASFDDLAYVIYTSGSTGRPKGVPITHSNLCPLLHWGYEYMGLRPGDRTLQNLAYYFDWSVWEIFITLTSGAGLYIASEDTLLNPEACTAFINDNGITVLHITPTQFRYLADAGRKLETLRYLCIGAEKLPLELLHRGYETVDEACRIFNMYGPTETTIMAAAFEVDRSNEGELRNLGSIPIGTPLGNTELLILNDNLKSCDVEQEGELYILGDSLACGYLNRPELTAERFNRFYRSYGSYRTQFLFLGKWCLKFLLFHLLNLKHKYFLVQQGENHLHYLKLK